MDHRDRHREPERHEQERLERAEANAKKKTSLRFRRRGDGTTDIHARVSEAVAGRLKTYLDALTAPRRDHLDRNGRVDEATGERVTAGGPGAGAGWQTCIVARLLRSRG